MRPFRIGIVGQPNVGKSSLVNLITGSKHHVGNYSGATVKGEVATLNYNQRVIELVDLPGLYTIHSADAEEKIALESLEDIDAVVVVADFSNLKKTLALPLELSWLNKPMICLLNKSDKVEFDNEALEKIGDFIGMETVAVHTKSSDGIKGLVEKIASLEKKQSSRAVQSSIEELWAFVEDLKLKKNCRCYTKQIDNWIMNRYLGIPLFLFVMWIMFQATFYLSSYPSELLEQAIELFSQYLSTLLGSGMLKALIVDGIIGGVGAVVSFVPSIAILFFFIAILELTGYMSRVSYLLDGIFFRFGMQGKSFIPLVTGFGCTVPAYMAARSIEDRRRRLITLFAVGFMSCSARLPIYLLFVSIYVPKEMAGNALFGIYITGALLGLVVAWMLSFVIKERENRLYLVELPGYSLPSIRQIFRAVWMQVKSYLQKAGSYILVAVVAIWFLTHFPLSQKSIEQSYIAKIGKASEPMFEPLGFDWKMVVALESGLAAKEVVVSTLHNLYVTDETQSLQQALKKAIPLPSAVAFILFVMIYLPCVAASAVFIKEAGGVRYFVYLLLFTSVVAWVVAYGGYEVTYLYLEGGK